MTTFFGSLFGSSPSESAEAQGRERMVHWQAFLREEERNLLRLMGEATPSGGGDGAQTAVNTPSRLAVLEEYDTEDAR